MMRLTIKIGFVWVLLTISGCTDIDDTNNDLPQKLGDMTLSKVVQGSQAAAVIHKMHGKKLSARRNFIGYYGKEDAGNILYLSIYENDETAKADLMKMAMKMASGTRVFSPLTFGEMGDNVRFRTEGMGFAHYFYRVDNILIWWQVAPGKAESTFNALLSYDFTSLKKKPVPQK
jgi:hypothetical protein